MEDQTTQYAALAGLLHGLGQVDTSFTENVPAEFRGYIENVSREIILLADQLSAGETIHEVSETKIPPRRMMTIFDRISLANPYMVKEERDRKYLPLRHLMLADEVLFPSEGSEGDGYQELVNAMRSAVQQNPGDLPAYIENLLAAIQVSGWCIPSANSLDVSLYDHSRMTAALAVCVAAMEKSEIESLLNELKTSFQKGKQDKNNLANRPVALLIGGDISGIQNFIYTITSKKAAQTLRGRSFYLQLLTEAVLRFVLNELGLPYTNVIYSGGGHFFLLAPVNVKGKIPAIRRQITEIILDHHGTSLYYALGFTEVPASGFATGIFPEYWNKMHADMGLAKQRRYTELDSEIYERIFAVPEDGGNPDATCSVCGNDEYKTRRFEDYDETQSRICTLCDSFWEEIGKHLPEAKFVALGWQTPIDMKPGTLSDVLKSFGMQFKLVKDEREISFDDAQRIAILALDDPKNGYPTTGKVPSTHSLRYTVNDIPKMTFDELQDEVEGGFERLGVLRMDVDSLGDIFKKGLGKYATLARVSTLSFQMSVFFEGWVKRICDEPMFKGKIYSVYAGGDDIFLVGPWDVMPELALKIRNDFADYTSNHPDLHISAGLAFIGGKYPVYQAAEDADVALSSAKKNKDKNSFGFLGQTWKWSEFADVRTKFEQIVNIIDEDKLGGPQAIAQILQGLAEAKKKKAERLNNKDVWGAWQWRGAYLLKRMEEREKDKPKLAEEIARIHDDLEPSYSNIHEWGAAARWAQLKTRRKPVKVPESM
jgi:CRISPR-associated protein Csm1